MNLVLGYEMGNALLKECQNAAQTKECWSQALSRAPQSPGPQLYKNVERIEKGAFPQQLGRLRGQLSLNASGDEPVAVVLECGPKVLTLFANDNKSFYGVWNVAEERFYGLKAEEMYGTHLTTLLKELCHGVGDVWIAYFIGTTVAPAAPPPPPPKEVVILAVPLEEEEEVPATVLAPVVKKKAVRKRPAPATTILVTESSEEPLKEAKKEELN